MVSSFWSASVRSPRAPAIDSAASARRRCAGGSILREVAEAVRVHVGVSDGRFNPAVSEKRLNRARILALRSEAESLRVAEHVRMRGERKPGYLAAARDDAMDRAHPRPLATLPRQ